MSRRRVNRDLGCDTLWLDAGWFEGDFPNGVGNWFPKTKDFPRGLRPVGDACQRLGLKFLVWYEPERRGTGNANRPRASRVHPARLRKRRATAACSTWAIRKPGVGSPIC